MKKILQLFVLFAVAIGLFSATPSNRIYPVEVKSYLLTDKQLIDAGNFYAQNKQINFEQFTFHQLKNKPTFIVVLAKNQGEYFVSGVLKGSIASKTFEIPVFGLPKEMEESAVWVIPVGNTYLGEGSALPQIKMDWKEFNVQ